MNPTSISSIVADPYPQEMVATADQIVRSVGKTFVVGSRSPDKLERGRHCRVTIGNRRDGTAFDWAKPTALLRKNVTSRLPPRSYSRLCKTGERETVHLQSGGCHF